VAARGWGDIFRAVLTNGWGWKWWVFWIRTEPFHLPWNLFVGVIGNKELTWNFPSRICQQIGWQRNGVGCFSNDVIELGFLGVIDLASTWFSNRNSLKPPRKRRLFFCFFSGLKWIKDNHGTFETSTKLEETVKKWFCYSLFKNIQYIFLAGQLHVRNDWFPRQTPLPGSVATRHERPDVMFDD